MNDEERKWICKEHGILTRKGDVYFSLSEGKHRCQRCDRVVRRIKEERVISRAGKAERGGAKLVGEEIGVIPNCDPTAPDSQERDRGE
jgi:hypothetical protein